MTRQPNEIPLAPICSACGVAYTEDYEGPCQEPRGTYNEYTGWSSACAGRVSWRATAEALHAHQQRREAARDYRVELFRGRSGTQDVRATRAPGA